MKVEMVQVLKPYRVRVPKRKVRKLKPLYEVHFENNNSLYTEEMLSKLKTLNFNNDKFTVIENPSEEALKKIDAICDEAQSNNIVLTASIRCKKLYDNLSHTYIVVAMRIPKVNMENSEITGYDYKISIMTHEGYESQLGQFCKVALITGGNFVYQLMKQCNLVSNLSFTIFTNSKNNRNLMNSGELKELYSQNYKTVQNKRLYHQLYLCKNTMTNCGYRFMDGNTIREIVKELEASR